MRKPHLVLTRSMRLCLLASVGVLLAAIYLHLGGVQTDTKNNIFFYNNGEEPNVTAYVTLLEELRSRLAGGTAHGIAVTRPLKNIPLKERFIQLQLENVLGGQNHNITVIIDTVNVYVYGYIVGSTFFNFEDIPEEVFQVFPKTQFPNISLKVTSNYRFLPDRDEVPLGHGALNTAIQNLYYYQRCQGNTQLKGLLVIMQMVSEAVRIRYIDHLVRRNMLGKRDLAPDTRAICMENEWSDLSEQIQWSGESGIFFRTIVVANFPNEPIPITSVVDVLRQAMLDLMLLRSNNNSAKEPITKIIGRDGQCMAVKDDQYHNGNAIILWACGDAQSNLWTFKTDGTIRSNGKCLTYSGNQVMLFDCDTTLREATQWLFLNGTIMNPKTGLVITAETSTEGTVLTVAKDDYSSSQAWSAGNDTQPTINYISGYPENMCLQSNRANASVSLANCSSIEPQWALYGDSTIRRLYSDLTLCVTSDSCHSGANIILLRCKGVANQRWIFMADGTILNPNARLVMDAPSPQEIILSKPTGKPSQKWFPF